jgi:hypothetical protein
MGLPGAYGGEEPKSGIKLTNGPPTSEWYEIALQLELPEELAVPAKNLIQAGVIEVAGGKR